MAHLVTLEQRACGHESAKTMDRLTLILDWQWNCANDTLQWVPHYGITDKGVIW